MLNGKEILKHLPLCNKKNSYGLFVGAGISRNSGIPVVSSIISEILKVLPLTKYDQRHIKRRKFPFEAFIQRIQTIVPIVELLEIFTIGQPNHTHQLITALAKNKIIQTIVTTNFDTLIEDSLKEAKISFEIISTLKGLETISNKSQQLLLLKIHGSVENINSLGIVLRQIVSRQNLYAVEKVLKQFFFSKKYNTLFFLGYSCSDFFDIVPQIELLYKSKKDIYFLKHSKKTSPSYNDISLEHCFAKYSKGSVINCNADSFALSLGREIIGPDFNRKKTTSLKWKTIINAWAKKYCLINSGINGLILSGWLMNFTGDYNQALPYYNLASLKLPKNKSVFDKLAKIATYSAQVYRHLGNYPEAYRCFADALFYWRSLRNRNNYAKTLSDIGSTYRVEGNFREAIDYQQAALRIFRKTKNKTEIQICYIIIGNSYLNAGKNRLAKRYYLNAKELFRHVSDKQNEAILLNSLGAVYIKLKDLPEAKSNLEKAEYISSKLGMPRISVAIDSNWGSYYEEKEEFKEAFKKLRKALKLALDTNDEYQSLIILKSRSKLYEKLGNLQSALQDIEEAISLITANKKLKKKELKNLTLLKRNILKKIKVL